MPFRRWTTKQKIKPVSTPTTSIVIAGKSIFLKPPIEPLVRILPSSFLGQASNPLLQYPVHEHIQAEVDLDIIEPQENIKVEDLESPEEASPQSVLSPERSDSGPRICPDQKDGSFLVIGPSHSTLINQIGDPNPGSEKMLRLDVDMQGFQEKLSCEPQAATCISPS